MLISARTFIASPDSETLEKVLLQEPAFLCLGSAQNGKEALQNIISLSPDLLILDSMLPCMDGFSLLEHLQKALFTPPRVLFLCRMKEKRWLEKALEMGADSALSWPDESDGWLLKAKECALLPLPALSGATESLRLSLGDALLESLKMDASLRGYAYIRESIAALSCAPQLLWPISYRLYPYLGKLFSASPSSVERAIRTAVENTWLHGPLPVIQSLFGFSVDADRGKPTNAEFLSMLAEHIRREGERIFFHPSFKGGAL